jgi:hypothetical protein
MSIIRPRSLRIGRISTLCLGQSTIRFLYRDRPEYQVPDNRRKHQGNLISQYPYLSDLIFAGLSHDELRTAFEDAPRTAVRDKFVNRTRDAVVPKPCVMIIVAHDISTGLELAPV